MIEKRRFPRLGISAEVEYSELAQEGARTVTSANINLSAGGLCMIVFDKIPSGTALSLKFTIPELREIVMARVRVAWCNPKNLSGVVHNDVFEVGLEFIDISEADRQKINRYVLSRQAKTN